MLVKLVQNQTHAVHQTVHVCRLTLFIPRSRMRRQRRLKRLKVLHPLDRKIVRRHVRLVEHEYKRELRLVQYAVTEKVKKLVSDENPRKNRNDGPTRIQHVGHERRRSCRPRGVDDVRHHGRKGGRDGIGDDSTRRGPGKDLNLTRSIEYDVTAGVNL